MVVTLITEPIATNDRFIGKNLTTMIRKLSTHCVVLKSKSLLCVEISQIVSRTGMFGCVLRMQSCFAVFTRVKTRSMLSRNRSASNYYGCDDKKVKTSNNFRVFCIALFCPASKDHLVFLVAVKNFPPKQSQ